MHVPTLRQCFTKAFLAVVVASLMTSVEAKEAVREPAKIALAPHADHWFHFGEWEIGEWLWLKPDGTYTSIERDDVEKVDTIDRGRWTVDGPRLVLDARIRVRDIETPEFDIHVQDLCGVDMLPELRRRIARIASDPRAVATSGGIFTAFRDGGRHLGCGAFATMDTMSGGAPMLARMTQAIDAYLAHPADRQRFVFDAYAYRNRTLLIPIDPGPVKMRLGLARVMSEFDRNVGDPQLIYLDVSRQMFEQVDACDFPMAFGWCRDLTTALYETLVRWFPSQGPH